MHNNHYNSWPFVAAQGILKQINYTTPKKGYVLFSSGYGPSGLPHIGTFGEIARTKMVMNAFHQISDIKTKLFCISDDMDGMRKVPTTIPNPENYKQYIGLPLSSVPDPFGNSNSFADEMNNRMKNFMKTFDFQNDFISASQYYQSGKFNEGLINVIENYDAVMEVILPTLGKERQETYSPFFPICKKTGKVLQVKIIDIMPETRSISYIDPESSEKITTSILDGNCKLQWKVDFAMRWAVLDVDFEMYGKDHQDSAKIYAKLSEIFNNVPPYQMYYEMFLNTEGAKVSKSKGNNALDIQEWLRWAPQETLAYFMYLSPQKAKRLNKDVIPRYVDEYVHELCRFSQDANMDNGAYHANFGNMPAAIQDKEAMLYLKGISYNLILNLVNACDASTADVVLKYLERDAEFLLHKNKILPILLPIINGAINYYEDIIKISRSFHHPSPAEAELISCLIKDLAALKNVAGAGAAGSEVATESTTASAAEVAVTEREKAGSLTAGSEVAGAADSEVANPASAAAVAGAADTEVAAVDLTASTIQTTIFNIAKTNDIKPSEFFKLLYGTMFGSSQGPRLGTFIYLYGIDNTIEMLRRNLK